jgi:hypothetical protein
VATRQVADRVRIEASLADYRRLLSWAKRFHCAAESGGGSYQKYTSICIAPSRSGEAASAGASTGQRHEASAAADDDGLGMFPGSHRILIADPMVPEPRTVNFQDLLHLGRWACGSAPSDGFGL